MVISALADTVARGVEAAGATVSEAFFEPVLRLGVTGLSRAGKTVFITSLVRNLTEPVRMSQLRAVAAGVMRGAYLQPQPDLTLPRFDYEAHLAALTGPEPRWPEGTRAVSELRLSFRLAPTGLLGSIAGVFTGDRRLHLDIIDYPGEWLLDLGLMERDYAGWSAEVLARLAGRPEAARFLAELGGTDPAAALDEGVALALARAFTGYLEAARAAGWADCTPGRFLLPGDLAGSPVLTFAPLPASARAGRRSLWRAFERRFEAYQRQVVAPFFQAYFARIDRQVVLVDLLEAVHRGPAVLEDHRRALAQALGAFRPGVNGWLRSLLGGRRIERVLLAATKADHLHHTQHPKLAALAEAMLREARDRARFAGAETAAMAIASVRATVEETRNWRGQELGLVRGRLADGRQAAFHPGDLPANPDLLVSPARGGAQQWLAGDYDAMRFAPPLPVAGAPGAVVGGLPHIRLDRAAEFLLGDRLM